jgi:EmrB/QacA subfamily drug resistance transporter
MNTRATAGEAPDSTPDPRRWRLLAFVSLAQFMVLLDTTVVALALPPIQQDLKAGTANIEWVVNAYVLCFGGLMLVGGRIADQWGRRRTLIVGVVLFTAASLACGLAKDASLLITARAAQGLGAALLSPTALSMVTTTFPEGKERNTALGVWAALSGLGGTLGVVFGGVVTDFLSWRWIFLVNIPVGVAVVVGVLLLASPGRPRTAAGRIDVPGALLITAGLTLLVLATVNISTYGWLSAAVLVPFAVSVVLLVSFVAFERRTSVPLVPIHLFSTRSMLGASSGRVLTAGVQAGVLFLGSFYLQRTLHYSTLKAGLAFLPLGVVAVLVTIVIPRLMEGLGPQPVYVAGSVGSLAALAWLAWFPVHDSYLAYVLPALLLLGISMQLCTVPVNVVGVSEVPSELHGVASAALTASFQIGTSLGVAVVASPALAHTTRALASGVSATDAWGSGLRLGFAVATAVAALNLVNALVAFPRSSATPAMTPAAVLSTE